TFVHRARSLSVICLIRATTSSILDLTAWRREMWPSFVFKLFGIALGLLAIAVIGQPWAVRRARAMAILVVSICYVLTATDRIISHGGEYDTTTVLFVGAALTTAAIVPWGVLAQLATVAVGATSLAIAVFLHDGTLGAVGRDPAAAVLIAFMLSLLPSTEVNQYRLGLRSELLERRRAESAVRRLAQRLEQRVTERTVELQHAHEALRQHQAELAHVLRLHTMGEMAAALAHE